MLDQLSLAEVALLAHVAMELPVARVNNLNMFIQHARVQESLFAEAALVATVVLRVLFHVTNQLAVREEHLGTDGAPNRLVHRVT